MTINQHRLTKLFSTLTLVAACTLTIACGVDEAGQVEQKIQSGLSTLKFDFGPGYTAPENAYSASLILNLAEKSFEAEMSDLYGEAGFENCQGSGTLSEANIKKIDDTLAQLTIKEVTVSGVLIDGGTRFITADDKVVEFSECASGTCLIVDQGQCELAALLEKLFVVDNPDNCPEDYSHIFTCVENN
jgi:hypothetical protein